MFKIIDNRTTSHLIRRWDRVVVVATCFLAFGQSLPAASAGKKFHLEEATIADIHNAIHTNQITCQELVQLYINRAKAYNGVCNQLVTEDGGSIPPAPGVVRAGSPIVFPTTTVLTSK